MAEVRHGTVLVTVHDSVAPDDRAATMNDEDVRRVPKARKGAGLVCQDAADAIPKAAGMLTLPPDVTAEAVAAAGARAENIDQVIVDMEVVLDRFKKSNLLFDAHAHQLLGRINDAVKTQSKQHPELLTRFQSVITYFSNKREPPKPPV